MNTRRAPSGTLLGLTIPVAVAGVLGLLTAIDGRRGLDVATLFGAMAVLSLLAVRVRKASVEYSVDRLLLGLCGTAIVYVQDAPFLESVAPSLQYVRYGLAAAIWIVALGVFVVHRRRPTGLGVSSVFLILAAELIAVAGSGLTVYTGLRFANWVMFLPVAVVFGPREYRQLLRVFCLSILVQVLAVGAQLMGHLGGTWGISVLGYASGVPLYGERLTGLLLNPNDLGLIAAIVLVMSVSLPGRKRERIVTGVAAAALLALTGSRGAALSLGFGLVLITLRSQLQGRRALMVFGSTALAVIGATGASQNLRLSFNRFISSIPVVLSGHGTSARARIGIWERYLPVFANWALGDGYGGYATTTPSVNVLSATSRAMLYLSQTVDNGWLQLLLEQGLLGVVVVGFVLVRAALSGIRAASPYAILSGVAVGMVVLRALSADVLDIAPWDMLLWLFVGAALAGRDEEQLA